MGSAVQAARRASRIARREGGYTSSEDGAPGRSGVQVGSTAIARHERPLQAASTAAAAGPERREKDETRRPGGAACVLVSAPRHSAQREDRLASKSGRRTTRAVHTSNEDGRASTVTLNELFEGGPHGRRTARGSRSRPAPTAKRTSTPSMPPGAHRRRLPTDPERDGQPVGGVDGRLSGARAVQMPVPSVGHERRRTGAAAFPSWGNTSRPIRRARPGSSPTQATSEGSWSLHVAQLWQVEKQVPKARRRSRLNRVGDERDRSRSSATTRQETTTLRRGGEKRRDCDKVTTRRATRVLGRWSATASIVYIRGSLEDPFGFPRRRQCIRHHIADGAPLVGRYDQGTRERALGTRSNYQGARSASRTAGSLESISGSQCPAGSTNQSTSTWGSQCSRNGDLRLPGRLALVTWPRNSGYGRTGRILRRGTIRTHVVLVRSETRASSTRGGPNTTPSRTEQQHGPNARSQAAPKATASSRLLRSQGRRLDADAERNGRRRPLRSTGSASPCRLKQFATSTEASRYGQTSVSTQECGPAQAGAGILAESREASRRSSGDRRSGKRRAAPLPAKPTKSLRCRHILRHDRRPRDERPLRRFSIRADRTATPATRARGGSWALISDLRYRCAHEVGFRRHEQAR